MTAISDVAAARDAYYAETGRYVPVVADGGMRRGGELAKAVAAGADALMLGCRWRAPRRRPAARTGTSRRRPRSRAGPDRDRHRRHARADPVRPGARHRWAAELVRACWLMVTAGARTIRDMQAVELIHAPSAGPSGKSWQRGR